MVMFPNIGMSGGNGSMRSLEMPRARDAPKFKARSVSAIRQFPHMCGPEYEHFKVESEEIAAMSGGENVAVNFDSVGGVMTGSGVQDQPDGAGTSTGLEVPENAGLQFSEPVEKPQEANGAQMLPIEEWENYIASKKLLNSGGWDNGTDTVNGTQMLPLEGWENYIASQKLLNSGLDNGTDTVNGTQMLPLEAGENHLASEKLLNSGGWDNGTDTVNGTQMLPLEASENHLASEELGWDSIDLDTIDFEMDIGVEAQLHEVVGSPVEEERDESVDMMVEGALKGIVLDMDEMPIRMVSIVKDVETESVKDHESKGMNIEFPKEVQPSVEKLVHRGVEDLVKRTNEDGERKPCSEGGFLIQEEVSASSSKVKFCRRSVSAKRDFPLYCGLDAVAPPAEEDQNVGIESIDTRAGNSVVCSGQEDGFVFVNALVKAKSCPWRQPKVTTDSGGSVAGGSASTVKKATTNANAQRSLLKKMARKGHFRDEDENSEDEAPRTESKRSSSLLDSCASSSNDDARYNVRDVLRNYQTMCRKLLQGEEARFEDGSIGKEKIRRIDLEAAKMLKKRGKVVNAEPHHFIGSVPGVEVGDEFQYRVELAIVGIHRLYQGGIDYATLDGQKVAVSIVASGGYDDDLGDPNVLIYSGQGGNPGRGKQAEDQKLERGNLALWNSKTLKNPVRVVRGTRETDQDKSKIVTKYVYDGLYTVEDHWLETGEHGKLVYMFKLRRNEGQPEVAWKELKGSKKTARVRVGVCVDDIAQKEELYPIGVVNTVDDEKPPAFNYIKKVMYPKSLQLQPGKGCSCLGKCSDSQQCSCAMRNGGEIPYNRNGAIVETKAVVYECGPHCKCPPSCYNRVSQSGIKLPLEVFKTDERGWGVRALCSISSGSFICEYTGEILDEMEAEKRTNDVYLFDIGQKHSDTETGGPLYTIDALRYGNVGRFINHSCSPNLYAQNVIYDHDDKRVPHIMLFAAENIPPLQELTYDYNYSVDQVHDSNGNVKVKECRCGATGCTGRLY